MTASKTRQWIEHPLFFFPTYFPSFSLSRHLPFVERAAYFFIYSCFLALSLFHSRSGVWNLQTFLSLPLNSKCPLRCRRRRRRRCLIRSILISLSLCRLISLRRCLYTFSLIFPAKYIAFPSRFLPLCSLSMFIASYAVFLSSSSRYVMSHLKLRQWMANLILRLLPLLLRQLLVSWWWWWWWWL